MPDPVNSKISSAYRHLAIAFLVMMFVVTVVRAMLKSAFGQDYVRYLVILFAPSAIILFLLAVRVAKRVNASTLSFRLVVGLLAIGFLMRLTAVFFLSEPQSKFGFSLASSFFIMAFLTVIMALMTRNLFSDTTHIVEKLWASVCVYFMISLLFGTYNSILLLLNPDALGVTISHPLEIYLNGMVYSVNILSGFDPVFQQVSESMQMGAIMESMISTLFLVVLLGRLLGSPH